MKVFSVLAILLAAATTLQAAGLNELTTEEKSAGWKLLFNGKDLAGWRTFGKKEAPGAGWAVENGVLRKLPGVRGGDIVTERAFDDFELSWEWRLAAKANNGLKYLVTEKRGAAPGHEYQMIDDALGKDVAAARRQTASLYDVLPPAPDKPLKPTGEWNSSRLVIKGNHVEHWLNGAKVLEYELGSAALKEAIANSKFAKSVGFGEKAKGRIMLTDHGDECSFRNVKIRELK